jgi:hypothetical protein
MQTRSKKSAARPKTKEVAPQPDRFKAMALEVGVPKGATLDRTFTRVKTKKPAKANS